MIALRQAWAILPLLPQAALAAPASPIVPEAYRWLAVAVFAAVIGLALLVTFVAARRARTAAEFYTVGNGLSAARNGWAIAGDYLSAASFLGITGLVALWGFDGLFYAVGWLVAYVAILLILAEPCRNLGKHTLPEILAVRNHPAVSRTLGALSVVVVSAFYLVAQMVGGGVLIKAVIGIDYEVSVVAVGAVMLVFVLLGGMAATTRVQIVKAGLLLGVSLLMVLMLWSRYGFFGDFFASVVGDPRVQARVGFLLGDAAAPLSPQQLGERFLAPGLMLGSPFDAFSLGLALVFGAAGLPHILMRFFTVPTAQAARRSVLWATGIIGGFYVLTLFIGLGAAMLVGAPTILDGDAGGNLAAPLLAQALGGGADSVAGNFLLALVAAIAFATIVAVTAALLLAVTTAVARDLIVGMLRGGKAGNDTLRRISRVTAVVCGLLAIVLGILAKGQNVAHLVALAFAVAASANFPCIVMTLFWRRCNTGGVVAGLTVGLLAAIGLILISPNMVYPETAKAAAQKTLDTAPIEMRRIDSELRVGDPVRVDAAKKARAALGRRVAQARETLERYRNDSASIVGLREPLFPLHNPGLVSVPLGFLAVILGSLCYRDPRALAMWDEMAVRRNTGTLAATLRREN